MKKIGVVGLGNIFQKAYLPIMNQMNEQVEWHYFSRNQEKLKDLKNKHSLDYTYSEMADFMSSGIEACFIHTPTTTHPKFVRQMLENNIHVYVDKPISENLSEVVALTNLARENNLVLFAGFNRRRAPYVKKLQNLSDKNIVWMKKNSINSPQEVKFVLYDLFIHVVDTVLFLLGEAPEKVSTKVVSKNGQLYQVISQIETSSITAIASMNLVAGARSETIEVETRLGTFTLENLGGLSSHEKNESSQETFGDWVPVLERRGFEATIQEFVELIKENTTEYDDLITLTSHKIISDIYDQWIKEN